VAVRTKEELSKHRKRNEEEVQKTSGKYAIPAIFGTRIGLGR